MVTIVSNMMIINKMNYLKSTLAVFIILCAFSLCAQDGIVYEDRVFDEKIKSVQLYINGQPAIVPIIGRNGTLTLRFDEMSDDANEFFYQVIHCDRYWQASDLEEIEYIDGFNGEEIQNYEFSTNTYIDYVNFSLTLPNERLNKAKNSFVNTVVIASLDEADDRMKGKSKDTKTWKFHADQVRDFAFATSRRFIWDALNVKLPNSKTAMAMSMYVKEGDCLWAKYSTKTVAHALYWYSHYSCDYPYPVAWSIDGSMGMEYPMICFNYGRCEEDGTYGERMKYGHIGVIIHEVGHNFFPMIINSDERQWTWMDEGLTTFVQYLSEQQFERNYPSRRGEAQKITSYMGGDKSRISPIMTNSESIFQFGANAYSKPATALNILRETIMGRELFDYAFKEYSERWKFKSPSPSDFFRTMEDASGVDLDWFWRGWFYTNDHVDLALGTVKHFKADPKDPTKQEEIARANKANQRRNISSIRNEEEIKQTYNEKDPTLDDYYTTYDRLAKDAIDKEEYEKSIADMSKEDIALLNSTKNYYEVEIKKIGGLVMPVILEFEYVDGTTEVIRIPAEIWRFGQEEVTKVFPTDKEVKNIVLDPFLETADVDTNNNYYPPRQATSRFETFKRGVRQRGGSRGENPMQRAKRAKTVIKP